MIIEGVLAMHVGLRVRWRGHHVEKGFARRVSHQHDKLPLPGVEIAIGGALGVWRAAGDDDYGRVVRLLILTGCRREEVGGLRWTEVDAKERLIRLPGERCKNGRPHEVPLTDMSWSILQEQPAGEHVFGPRGFSQWSRGKRELDQRLGDAVASWRLHDIRRTTATGMADLGVMPHVIEAALNHQSGFKRGVAGTYNRSRYEREVRAALTLWAEHVASLIDGKPSKVVAMPARGGR